MAYSHLRSCCSIRNGIRLAKALTGIGGAAKASAGAAGISKGSCS